MNPSDPCKHCGACQNHVRCSCCGYCRNCGQFIAAPYLPYWPYWQTPPVFPQPIWISPHWNGGTASGSISTGSLSNAQTFTGLADPVGGFGESSNTVRIDANSPGQISFTVHGNGSITGAIA